MKSLFAAGVGFVLLMSSVAGIDVGLPYQPGQHMRGTGAAVTDHDDVRIHGFQIPGRIRQGFSLDQTAC